MTVLVTGGAGWLGRRLVKALVEAGRGPVRCLVQPGEGVDALPSLGDGVEVFRGDVRDSASLGRFVETGRDALLFHCAGVIHPRLFTRELFAVNAEGGARLLSCAAEAGVRRAVVMSSNSPVGTHRDPGVAFDEAAPYAPYMAYGRSKMKLELAAREHTARGDLETVIVRAPWFYGPGQPPRQSEFFRMIRRGRAPIVGDGRNVRSMAYVDDLAAGLVLAADDSAASGETYWIADERPYTTVEIVDTVERLLRDDFGLPCDGGRWRLPAPTARLAQIADAALQAVGLYEQRVHVLSEMDKNISCTIEKARRELGYRPTVGLEEGMRRSIAWCLEQGIDL